MVDQETWGQGGQPKDPPEDVTRIIHELAEALTAIGNFVTVAARISDGANPTGIDIRRVLEGASGQHERAATALHQLRTRLLTRRKIS
jgi:hypothetical protein